MYTSLEIVNLAYASLGAFFLGAIPTAYLAARMQGINIFDVGSRQAGATNVWKQVNRKTGFVVFIIDVAKGIAIHSDRTLRLRLGRPVVSGAVRSGHPRPLVFAADQVPRR